MTTQDRPFCHAQYLYTLLLLIILSIATSSAGAKSIPLKVLVYSEHKLAIHQLLNEGKPCEQKSLYNQPHIAHMEALLLCRALHLGGTKVNYEVISVPNQPRAVSLLEEGASAIFVGSVWSYLASTKVFLSAPLIEYGEYEKGLYTSKKNRRALSFEDGKDITELTAVVGSTWKLDRKILDCLGLEQTYVTHYPQMLRMVYSQRIDVFLQNFTRRDDLELHDFDTVLKPIPGVKVSLPDSLHFFVSKQYPESRHIYESLNKGLMQLKENGELRSVYEDVGFYNPTVKNWKTLSCNKS